MTARRRADHVAVHEVSCWPLATDHVLTADGRYRSEPDM